VEQAETTERSAVRRPARLGDEVYEVLYAQLMTLRIPPGGRISVDNLVRTLGVSQTPIREALSRLEAQGLVVKTHLVGYRAADQLDRSRFEELYELRLLLEPFAAGRVAATADSDVIDTLRSLDADMRRSCQSDTRATYGQFAKHDAAFHSCIASRSGNDLLFESLTRLHTHVHLFRLFYLARATTEANVEHADIIQAIADHDSAKAEASMARHIASSRTRFIGAFDPQ